MSVPCKAARATSDLWDPKPDAPANIRGDFKGIPTKIPGTHIR